MVEGYLDIHNWLRCGWRSAAARAVAARRPHFGEAHVGVEWAAAEHVLERSGFSPPRQVAARLPRACPHCAHPEETVEHQLWHCPRLDAVRLQAAAPFGVDPIPSAPQTRAAHPPLFVEATLPSGSGCGQPASAHPPSFASDWGTWRTPRGRLDGRGGVPCSGAKSGQGRLGSAIWSWRPGGLRPGARSPDRATGGDLCCP